MLSMSPQQECGRCRGIPVPEEALATILRAHHRVFEVAVAADGFAEACTKLGGLRRYEAHHRDADRRAARAKLGDEIAPPFAGFEKVVENGDIEQPRRRKES